MERFEGKESSAEVAVGYSGEHGLDMLRDLKLFFFGHVADHSADLHI